MTTPPTIPRSSDRTHLSRWALLGLWFLAFVSLVATLHESPVSRTQEARVLETARQMVGSGWHGWIVPMLNGRPRLQKPPLTYWMAAGSFVFHNEVNEAAGRIPTALCGLLTLALTFAIARRLFDERTALLSAAVLLTSYLFFRFDRLAETDAPATLFVTLAIYAILRAKIGSTRWLHLAGAATGLAILAKGGPGAYPPILLLALCAIEHNWTLAKKSLTTGAFIWIGVVALPWFIYIAATLGTGVFHDEVEVVTKGSNHFGWPTIYIPLLFKAVAPWTGAFAIALIDICRRWKSSAADRFIGLWALAILLPLCLIGNKQEHYLLTLTPALAMMIGRSITAAAQPGYWSASALRWILLGTIAVGFIASGAMLYLPKHQTGSIQPIDLVCAILVALAASVALVMLLTHGLIPGYFSLAAGSAVLLPLIISVWVYRILPPSTRDVADQIRAAFDGGPYVYFGGPPSLPLCFNLRQSIHEASPNQLGGIDPNAILIVQSKFPSAVAPVVPPADFALQKSVDGDDQRFDLYRRIAR